MARCVARCWGVVWPARAAVFSRLHGVKNREGRPASSTGQSRARQGAGPPDGHGFRLEAIRSPSDEGTDPPAIVGETAKTGIHTGAQRKKYGTNLISRKPIAINELRLVLRAKGKIGEADTFPRAEARANRSSPN